MDTLSLIDSNPETDSTVFDVESVPRDRLFFDQYQYVFEFVLHDLYCVRGFRHAGDVESAQHSAVQRYQNRQEFRRLNFNSPWSREAPDAPEVVEWKTRALTTLAGFLKTHEKSIKLVISSNVGYLYTNQFELIEHLIVAVPTLTYRSPMVQQARVDVPAGCISLQNSQYQYRSYFNGRRLLPEKRQQLSQFLLIQSDVRLSPSLSEWCNGKSRRSLGVYRRPDWIDRHFFLDHNNTNVLLMMSLIESNIIRKTLNIVVVNNWGDNHGKNL